MESMKEIWRRIRSLGRRDAMERRLDEEIRFHIDQQTEKNIRAGMSPQDARRRAAVAFGGTESARERVRDEVRPALLEDFARDLRYGARVLRRAPGFATIAIVTLALGIGAATAVFSVVDGVLLQPLPYPDSDRIVRLYQVGSTGSRGNVSEPNFEDWKSGTRSFKAMAEVAAFVRVPVSTGGEQTMTPGATVSREFFEVMEARPVVGRGFLESERRVGAAPVAIVSHGFWQDRLGGGRLGDLTVQIDGALHQVVGVMAAEFDYPLGTDFWVPREQSPPQRSRTAHNFQVVARLADGVDLRTARTELGALSRALKAAYGDETWMFDAAAVPLREQLTASARPTLLLLLGAAALLLVIACLNVSNLQLARASTRQRELAVRLAIGAGRWRVIRQLLAEALVLSMAAGTAGVLAAALGVQVLLALQPGNVPRIDGVGVDLRALAFALVGAGASAAVLALVTALRSTNRDLREALSDGQRTVAGARGERARQAFVVGQVALTTVLLAGGSLLARSFIRLLAVDPGFRTEGVLILDLTWPYGGDTATRARRANLQQQLIERLGALPGVEDAGLIDEFPIGPGYFSDGQFIEMTRADEIQSFEDVKRLGEEAKSRAGYASYRIASAGYFSSLGIPLLRGRLFEESDGPGAPHVAVISESLARAKWPDRDPIGRFVQFGNMDGDLRGFRIVGVVGDVREESTEAPPEPIFYGHYRQRYVSRFSLVARTLSPGVVATAARQAVRELDAQAPLEIRTVDEALDSTLAGRRFSLTLIGVFSGAALVLAALGIYGLISYLVAERTREFGIRLALGAEATDVLRLVVGRGTILAAIGMVIGIIAALALTRLLEGMLFGISPTDPIAFGGVLILTLITVIVASYVPARRAMRIAPATALRGE
jgi:predicted permease